MDFLYGSWCKLTTLNKSYNPITHNCVTKRYKKTRDDKLRVMSYNIKALFPFYNAARIQQIIEYIEELFLNGTVDIICLQEAFELDLYKKLYELSHKLRLNIVHPSLERKYYVGENSGLVVISRYPVIDHTFLKYEECSGLCRFANKGAHYITIDIHGHKISLVNTHLQADNEEIAINQFGKLVDNIQNNALIVGDLNMKYDTVLQILEDVVCVNKEKVITFPEYDEQLDYFLLHNLDLECSFKVLNNVEFSDHLPILTTFTLSLFL
jgi:endonuclease/exonuclease/phosphatase family metal-dependent hydrolase